MAFTQRLTGLVERGFLVCETPRHELELSLRRAPDDVTRQTIQAWAWENMPAVAPELLVTDHEDEPEVPEERTYPPDETGLETWLVVRHMQDQIVQRICARLEVGPLAFTDAKIAKTYALVSGVVDETGVVQLPGSIRSFEVDLAIEVP